MSSSRQASMSNDEATRIPPVRRFARDSYRLRGWQREGVDTTHVNDDHDGDEQGRARAWGPGAAAVGPLPSPLNRPRPLLYASNSHRARTPTRQAAPERETRWAVGPAQREGAHRTSPRR